tara:strand:- start:1511 stop:2461 length:951 start_codon:yes stop_codon:yes gene_type:complete
MVKEILFPHLEPKEKGYLKVSEIHEIYWERSGNLDGEKILILHGGPGGGSHPRYRRYFDPDKFDIIQFDQRGCGRSKPFSELRENTTHDLLNDIEKLRDKLHINKWHLFGGSWGSTLSLLYAIKNPTKVLTLTLRGIFLCRKFELLWFYQYGASEIFPDEFEKYISIIPKEERNDLIKAFYKYLTSSNSDLRKKAALAWTNWELSTSHLIKKDINIGSERNSFSDAFARIECHYFNNKIFLDDDDFILNNIEKIESIPTTIVQGRYDIVCPVRSAWDLNKRLKNCNLIIVDKAGHSMSEEGITENLLLATKNLLIK